LMVEPSQGLVIPYQYRKYMTPEEQSQIMRSFKNFDLNKNGSICRSEFNALLKDMGRTDVPEEKINEWFNKFDANNDGVIEWIEFVQMAVEIGESRREFGRQSSKNEEHIVMEGAGGSKSTYAKDEARTFAKLFNAVLDKDPYVGERLPIDPDSDDLWHAMSDGMLLICLLNAIEKDSVDMRAVNLQKPDKVVNKFDTIQNIELGLNAAKGKIKLVGTNV